MVRALLICGLLLGSSTGWAKDSSGPKVIVENAGKGAKKKLRMKVRKGAQATVTLSMKMDMDMVMGGNRLPQVPVPETIFSMSTTVDSVQPNGDYVSTSVIDSVEVKPSEGAPAPMIDGLRRLVKSLHGLAFTTTATSRGAVRSVTVETPPGMDRNAKKMVDDMRSSFEQLAVPLPQGAVGVGARWTVDQTLAQNGMKIGQRSEVKLTGWTKDTVTLETKVVQHAENQNVEMPGMQPGASLTLEKLSGSGTAKTTLSLRDAVPKSATTDTKTQIQMRVSGLEGGGGMSMKIRAQVAVKSAPKSSK